MGEDTTKEFCKIPARLIEKYGDKVPFDLFIKLDSGKVIKISHQEDDVRDVYSKYKAKGVENVYADKESFEEFVSMLRQNMSSKFFDQSTMEDKTATLDDAHNVVKEHIQKFGVTEKNIKMAKDVSNKTLKLIEAEPNIFKFYKNFKGNCSKEYLHNVVLIYTINALLDSIDWTSDPIREKSILAVMLRDLTLSPEHFKEIENWDGNTNSLSEETLKHPLRVAEMLQDKNIKGLSNEVVTIIQVHHELPNGDGFPRGLRHQQIPQLAAVHIVADHFVEELIKNKFDYGQKGPMLENIKSKLNFGSFKKPVDALHDMLGLK